MTWPFTLMAGFPGLPDYYLTNLPLTETGNRVGIRKLTVVTGYPWVSYQLTPPDPTANFPYGFTVLPDH